MCRAWTWSSLAEAARLLRPGGRLVFHTTSVLVNLCLPGTGYAGRELARPQREMYRLPQLDGGVEFHPGHGEGIYHRKIIYRYLDGQGDPRADPLDRAPAGPAGQRAGDLQCLRQRRTPGGGPVPGFGPGTRCVRGVGLPVLELPGHVAGNLWLAAGHPGSPDRAANLPALA